MGNTITHPSTDINETGNFENIVAFCIFMVNIRKERRTMKALQKALIVFIILIGIGKQGQALFNQSPPDTLHFVKTDQESNDTIEYRLIILDPGFDTWFARTKNPQSFYHEPYLENWNRTLAGQWNALITAGGGRRSCLPETYLNYDSRVDYGMELNHKLFYYFRFVQEKCRPFTVYPGSWN